MNTKRPLIFLNFGASGPGKSTLVRELEAAEPGMSIHRKGTDRPARQYDGAEIVSKRMITPQVYDYVYNQYGHKYGVQRKQINAAVKAGMHHFIICNDTTTIEKIRRDYPGQVRVIFLSFDAPQDTLQAIQKARGISDDEILLRLEKINILNQIFVDHMALFDAVVVNKFDSPPIKMVTQIRRIIAAEETPGSAHVKELHKGLTGIADVVDELQRRLQTQAPKVGAVAQRDYLFILMAMLKDDPFLEDVHAAVIRAGRQIGLRAERVDDIAHSSEITDKVLGSIRCAEYVVADLTHERPNVYYELGYAHAFGKKVILTAREGTRLHFDIRNYPVIMYGSAAKLEAELMRLLLLMDKRHDSDIESTIGRRRKGRGH